MLSNARNTLITGGTFITTSNSSGNSASLSAFERLEKATAHAAFHNSIDRPDPPRCHPRTRLAIQAQIRAWIERQEDPGISIMWLTGGAGAGKSAIAQCIAEQCEEEGRLGAGFFFGRSDPARNDGRKLVATIAYQLCLNISGFRELVDSAINHDPLILTRSLASQMKGLIIDPFRRLQINVPNELAKFYTVIIDGLDECYDRNTQCIILTTISDALSQECLPLRFLVVSRPESHITRTMASKKLARLHIRRILDETLSPDQDIELFLRESFDEIKETHVLKSYIPSNWPSNRDMHFLVRKASGHFIYASVVIKYIQSPRRRPTVCLDNILGLRPNSGDDTPFAELDRLYHYIMEDVDNIEMVMQILSFLLLGAERAMLVHTSHIEYFLGLSAGDLCLHLDSMSSIVKFSNEEANCSLSISHASFGDFLRDKIRSSQFFMDAPMRCEVLARRCFHHLRNTQLMGDEKYRSTSVWYSQLALEGLCMKSALTPELRSDISEFSIFSVRNLSLALWFGQLHLYEMWMFVRSIETLKLEDGKAIMHHHLQDMCTFVMEHIEEYYVNNGLITLISIFSILRSHIYEDSYETLVTVLSRDDHRSYDNLGFIDSGNFALLESVSDDWNVSSAIDDYLSFLQECVEERERKATHPLDHRKYTVSALHLLQFLLSYLRKHEAKFHPRYSSHDLKIRRKYPYRWRNKKFGIHGTLTWTRLDRWRAFKISPAQLGDIDKNRCKNFVNTNVLGNMHGYYPKTSNLDTGAYEMAIDVLPYVLNRSEYDAELSRLAETIVFPFQLINYDEDQAALAAVQGYLRRHLSIGT